MLILANAVNICSNSDNATETNLQALGSFMYACVSMCVKHGESVYIECCIDSLSCCFETLKEDRWVIIDAH